jgi:SDR family mycofactocin-dependent oxidoreductase
LRVWYVIFEIISLGLAVAKMHLYEPGGLFLPLQSRLNITGTRLETVEASKYFGTEVFVNQPSRTALMKKDSKASLTRRQLIKNGSLTVAGVAALSTSALAQPHDQPSGNGKPFGGKVALVTGAARGIGRATAIAFARAGAQVAICDIAQQIDSVQYALSTAQDLEETARLVKAEGSQCLSLQADVRKRSDMKNCVDKALARFGQMDVVVANAGITGIYSLEEMPEDSWQDILGVNLTGVANTMQAAIPHFKGRKQGRIVVLASMNGRTGSAMCSAYNASKWGVIGLMKSAALELAPYNINVNAVCPTGVRTGMTQNDIHRKWVDPLNPSQEKLEAALRSANALPVSFLDPGDVAKSVLFLASDEARFITGASLDVAAGMNARSLG